MKKLYKVNEELKGRTIEEVLEICKLNWTVRQENLYLENGKKIPNVKMNIREDNEICLGIVSDRYKPVNNEEAFNFVDNLIKDHEIEVENAGCFNNGENVYIIADIGFRYIDVIDKTVNCKLVFCNAHNGKGSIKVNVLPLIDSYPINIKTHSKRSWNAMHTKSVSKKIDLANKTLDFSKSYFESLINDTNRYASIKVSNINKLAFIEAMFPMPSDVSERKYDNVSECRESLKVYINGDTAFDLIMAVSQYITNLSPKRKTKNFEDNKFWSILNGHYLLDRAYDIVNRTYMK